MTKHALEKWLVGGIFLLLILLVANAIITFSLRSALNEKVQEARELGRPAVLQLTAITTDCEECFSIEPVIASLKGANVNFSQELTLQSGSAEAQKLIRQYNIQRLPTIVLRGEVDKPSIEGFSKVQDALVFQAQDPPYVDGFTGEVKGKVHTIALLDSRCTECANVSALVNNMEQAGIYVEDEKSLSSYDARAKKLIADLNVTKLPALLISDDIEEYPFVQGLQQAGLEVNKGYYVVESNAPYLDVATGKVRGLVSITLLGDESCLQCYDVRLHKTILARAGMFIDKDATVDVSDVEGKALIKKYGVERVPTVIIQGDVDIYEGFVRAWMKVGSVEEDGTLVFRELDALGPGNIYKDLTTGKLSRGPGVQEPVQ